MVTGGLGTGSWELETGNWEYAMECVVQVLGTGNTASGSLRLLLGAQNLKF